MKDAGRIALLFIVVNVSGGQTALGQAASASSEVASQVKAKPQDDGKLTLNADERSCKKFVQDFYDLYWNRFADKVFDPNFAPPSLDIFKLNPPVVSQELNRLMTAYEWRVDHEKPGPGAGGSILEYWDPVINGQGEPSKYVVTNVRLLDNRCLATVANSESTVQPELKRIGTRWLIINFHYPNANRKSDSSWIEVFSNK